MSAASAAFREAPAPGAVARFRRLARVLGQGGRVVAARPELGEDEELDAAGRGQVDHVERDLLVALGVAWYGQPLRYPDLEVALHIDTLLGITKSSPHVLFPA